MKWFFLLFLPALAFAQNKIVFPGSFPSSSWQPPLLGPAALSPQDAQYPENEAPGIASTEDYYNGRPVNGVVLKSLADKFIHVVSKNSNDTQLIQWLRNDWKAAIGPHPEVRDGSYGNCFQWSAWSANTEVTDPLDKAQEGILCSGVAFTAGELKELITSLYPPPIVPDPQFMTAPRKNPNAFPLNGYYDPTNIALAKLGLYGGGATSALSPERFLQVISSARQDGRAVMMDMDPGYQVWHQPIKQVEDVATEDGIGDAMWGVVDAATDLEPLGDAGVYQELTSLETELRLQLAQGEGVNPSAFCKLKRMLGETCDDLSAMAGGEQRMAREADLLNHLKAAAHAQHKVRATSKLVFIKHDLKVTYAGEPKDSTNPRYKVMGMIFASSMNILKTDTYPYVEVLRKNADGTRTSLRKQWLPSTGVVDGVEKITSTLPPKALKAFYPKPVFSKAVDPKREDAYKELLNMLSRCPSFHEASQFMDAFNNAILDNVISSAEAADLKKRYDTLKADFPNVSMLDEKFLEQLLSTKHVEVQGTWR